ncbi:hypothetical protein RHGRI_024063 [Rhododendron griersonianum]|uniref:Biotin carboxyl carrier protein of acetyl-CoA carboxylase n=1 Tax=Rhododendron griersonianum TaxID=479676 RepID=A0AAV6J624_9ERIC|nr:hypothetical protein RHGRI_024063 [Rhododendron griersonianum]
MASPSVPCPKTASLFVSSPQPIPKQHQHRSVSFQLSSPALLEGSSLKFQGSRHNKSNASKVFAQLNEVAVMESSNSAPIPETELELAIESAALLTVPDSSSISVFMTQVADLVRLVDSRDIVELQLKQLDCELIIRKKEALEQNTATAPVVMMQPHYHQAMAPYHPPQPSAPAPASAGPAPSPPALLPAPPAPAKPKSSHPPFKCPMAGTFYRAPAPGAPPFVKVGDTVQKGQVLCIVEAMKLMNEIEADRSGTIVEIIAIDGKPVSVDTPLFSIEP